MEMLSWLWRDLRYGLRSLKKDRRFALLAVLALTLGIGSTTVIFSVIYNGVLDPFPYPAANRLTTFYIHDVKEPKEDGRPDFSPAEFLDYEEQNHVFDGMIGSAELDILYSERGETLQFDGYYVTPNTFDFLGIPPLLGRPIVPADGDPGAPPVFALSYKLWMSQFNGDPSIVGKTFTLNGVPRTLVCIMPKRFTFSGADLWIPHKLRRDETQPHDPNRGRMYYWALGRLNPGITLKAAAADLDVIAQRLSKVYPKDYPKQFTVLTDTLTNFVVQGFKTMLYTLLAAVAMILLIACSNVANLLLSRATAREKEVAIRSSIGASRFHLIRQLLVESSLLAAAGGIAGCVVAYFGVKWVVAAIPPHQRIPDEAVITLNWPALLFAVGLAVLTTLLCGLAPAVHAVRGNLSTQLTGTGKGAGASFRHGKLRAVLVVFEVALSIVLLTGAGLMMRSFYALEHVTLGFNPENILVARLPFPAGKYDTAEQKKVFFQQILPRIEALPGVIAATETNALPPYGGPDSEVTVPGKTHAETWDALIPLVSEGFFKTLGLHLMRGRLLTAEDVDSARQVAVVNQTLAKNFFPNEDPIGQKIKFNIFDQFPDAPHDAYFEIVGVVNDSKDRGLQDSPIPEAFLPYTISGLGDRGVLVRTSANPDAMLKSVRQAIWGVDSSVALTLTGSLESFMERFSYAQPKFGLEALGAFAGIGLILVIIGVFSVMAYNVSLQTHDIGIRMSLGAQRANILHMILLQGLRLIGAGIALGLVVSLALTRLMANQIWGVSVNDPWTFSAVIFVILAAGLAACVLPAQRATRVDPLIALRYE